jgi:hypothetical protein
MPTIIKYVANKIDGICIIFNKTNGQSCRKKVNDDEHFDTEGVLENSPLLTFHITA